MGHFHEKKVSPPKRFRLPTAKTHEQCREFINAVEHPVYRACTTIIYACGLRLGEAVRLSVDSVDSQAMLLRKIGKRNRERIIPINDSILKLLRETWKIHRSPKWIFARPKGAAISDNSLGAALKAAREQHGLDGDFTSHVLRHSYATRLWERGVPIETIQMLLGHASRRSTQIYLHLTKPIQDDVRKQIDSFVDDLFEEGGAR